MGLLQIDYTAFLEGQHLPRRDEAGAAGRLQIAALSTSLPTCSLCGTSLRRDAVVIPLHGGRRARLHASCWPAWVAEHLGTPETR